MSLPKTAKQRMREYRERKRLRKVGYLSGSLILSENSECGSLTSYEGRNQEPRISREQWFEDWRLLEESRRKGERELPLFKYVKDDLDLTMQQFRLGITFWFCSSCGNASPYYLEYATKCIECGAKRK